MKKTTKLYNLIFPIWFLLFFPPVIFITILGNYVIDSLMIMICFYVYKLKDKGFNLKIFYKKNILKVWLYGFLADFIGAGILFLIILLGDKFKVLNQVVGALSYHPFTNPIASIIIISAVFVSAGFIFLFNYKLVFEKHIKEKALRFKIAMTIAIITAPWTFFLPADWIY
ncbi:hypothetical protein [Dethiothermospora halolimnae]|uniref:hypothetical protein n=1 Tax=Dethiothermospora halolimnae TaxID=3114390 RepID=UPI003CCB8B05